MHLYIKTPEASHIQDRLSVHASLEDHEYAGSLSPLAEHLSGFRFESTDQTNGIALLSNTWSMAGRGIMALGMIDQGMTVQDATQLLFRPEIDEKVTMQLDRFADAPLPTLQSLSSSSRHLPFTRLPEGTSPSIPIAIGANIARVAMAMAHAFSSETGDITHSSSFDRTHSWVKNVYTVGVSDSAAQIAQHHFNDARSSQPLSMVSVAIRDYMYRVREKDVEAIKNGTAEIRLGTSIGFTLSEIYGDGDYCRITNFDADIDVRNFRFDPSISFNGFKVNAYDVTRFSSSPEVTAVQVAGVKGMINELRSAARVLGIVAASANIHEPYTVPSVFQTGDEAVYHTDAVTHEATFRAILADLQARNPDMLPENINSGLPLEDLLHLCDPNVVGRSNRFKVTKFIVGPAKVRIYDNRYGEPETDVDEGQVLIKYDNVAMLSGRGAFDLYKTNADSGEVEFVESKSRWVS